MVIFFFQSEDGIRDLVRYRGLGDVYKRQIGGGIAGLTFARSLTNEDYEIHIFEKKESFREIGCLLYTSDAADERSSVDLGGRRIIKKKKYERTGMC